MAKYEQHDFVKEIKWTYEGREYKGYATYDVKNDIDGGIVALRNEKWDAFEMVEESETEFDLKELFDDIPEDVTDYELA